MMKTSYIKLYFITLLAFFAIDIVWLTLVASSFYQKYIGFLMSPTPNWLAAILFYLLFILGILVFVVIPGLKENSLKAAMLRAALFGLVTYATYDLTNLATLKDWPLLVTIVDLAWGTVLSLSVSFVSYQAGKRLKI
ncbi:MAG: DUF2177 domain-containing protein [Chloroflexi bacterium HGW-Chloroflexi-10]|nr:MAG: DUF2177 domain-containing protein [Chloroflexi bacterium HGW-Chloroflexi-10]